jgi:nucleotide-binding universal stress UspA family protein
MLTQVNDLTAARSMPERYRHVLVPMDGSELAAAVLPTARALAGRLGIDTRVVSVAGTEDEVAALSAQVVAQFGTELGDAVSVVVDADPAAAIGRRRAEIDAVLCMSTHGHGRLVGAVIGSVARSLIAASPEPLVVLGPHADRPTSLIRSGAVYRRPADWPAPLSQSALVACVDGTPESEATVSLAAAWAETLGLTLTVLTVAEDVSPPVQADATDWRRFGVDDPEAYVDRLVDRVGGGQGVSGVVIYDPIGVAAGVGDYSATESVALLALTTPARSGLERFRFGATAADIVRNAAVAALIIPASP